MVFSQDRPDGNILARWMAKLQEFRITFDYVKSRVNLGADALSRIPWAIATPENTANFSIITRKVEEKEERVPESKPVELVWEKDQDADFDLTLVKQWVTSGSMPRWSDIAHLGKDVESYFGLLRHLFLEQNVLKFKEFGKNARVRIVVPREKTQEIRREFHQGFGAGHQSLSKVLPKLKERFYWPGMKKL